MNNILTDDTKAIILLCGVLGKDRSVDPLTQVEYSTLVSWLVKEKMRPEDLIKQENIITAATGTGIEPDRLKALLGRGVQLGFTVEEWQQNGIWIISRSDEDYPTRYKKHLKDKAPPLLFGVGDRSLLQGGGVAIVGSRNVDQEGEAFTRRVAGLCVYNGMPVVSGGARGVDQIAMNAALDTGGITIGVLAENLLKRSLERSARIAIADGRLLLISPYHPKARFSVGTAMGRNKLIYALADYGLVVSAEHNKGGTWTGAKEELKRENSIPVFVRQGTNVPPGNTKLLELGAVEWPGAVPREGLKQQLADLVAANLKKTDQQNVSIFDYVERQTETVKESNDAYGAEFPVAKLESDKTTESKEKDVIYEAVLPVIKEYLESPVSTNELSATLKVSKSQLNIWLKKAVSEGELKKLTRPVRYQKIAK